MSVNFPTSLDTLTNPTTTDPQNNPSHAGQHSDANDAIEALEAKVGADSSAVTSSHDYKLGTVTGSNKAETQGNKRTSFQATPDDTHYPSEKLTKDSLDAKASLTDVKTLPTDLKISTASKGGVLRNIDGAVGDVAKTATGWIEDEKFGWYFLLGATSVSSEFDSAVTRTGKFTVKLSAINTTGRGRILSGIGLDSGSDVTISNLYKYGIPVKPSTSYRINCYVKTLNAATNSVFLQLGEWDTSGISKATQTTNRLTGDNNWTLCTKTFTTNSLTYFLGINLYLQPSGNISDAWFDVNSMTLEEVVTDTTFTGKVAEKIRPVLQAVTSTDNIDQYLDQTGAYTNTYALTNAVNEGATHIQTFTPTKKGISRLGVWVVAKGTGDWKLELHNSSNNKLTGTAITIPNASLTEGAFNYFDVPNIWASGDLHFHLYSSVADGTCKSNTSNDLETASYIQNYNKNTEGATLICNGIKTELKADKDGFIANSIIDLDNGKYESFFDFSDTTSENNKKISSVLFNSNWTNYIGAIFISGGNGIQLINAADYNIVKVNTALPIKHLKLQLTTAGISGAEELKFYISPDNITYTEVAATVGANISPIIETDILNGKNIFYIKAAGFVSGAVYWKSFNIKADLDTSSVPQGLFYPIGVNQFAETWKSTATTLSYVYRQKKYTNEYGVVMPAIELNDGATGAGTALGYIPLKIDNSQETTPAITILASSGVASDTILDADGEYVALSSGATEGSINYQVTITKNTLYLSSNSESVDSTQDPSHQGNFIVGVRQQGLLDSVKDIRDETELIRKGLKDTKELIRNSAMTLGFDTGTTDDYAITLQDFTGYKTGLSVIFRANTANTGASTLNINGMGAKAIVKGVSTALANNDILALMWCQCVYDGTNFVLLNPRAL